jgi:NAD(P)-dependent dehydrogenase (short-subunit alcohol dehydrogenase family)
LESDALFSVKDQVVLVSGGSRGIGRALAAGFAERGARVVIAGREQATLDKTALEISTGAHRVEAIMSDVSKPEDIARLVDNVIAKFERIDTLVSVAGINKRMRVENYAAEEFDWILNTNLRGAFLLAQTVGRHMIGRRSGSIINIDSLNTYAPLKGVIPYAISKAGVSMMTRGMAMEWGEHGVRVNAIAPGFFPTELSKKLWQQDKMIEWGETNTPMGKLGDVRDLVGSAIFLASAAANFVTGQVLRVDGGVSAGIAWPIDL